MFVVGTLLKILLAGKSCRLVLCGHLSSEMLNFGVKLVIFVSVQDLESLCMGPQQPITSFGPFEKWGIDAIGPLPRTAVGKEYILVGGDDYMTRWAEASPTSWIIANGLQPRMWLNLCLKTFVAGLVHLLRSSQIEDLDSEVI